MIAWEQIVTTVIISIPVSLCIECKFELIHKLADKFDVSFLKFKSVQKLKYIDKSTNTSEKRNQVASPDFKGASIKEVHLQQNFYYGSVEASMSAAVDQNNEQTKPNA